MIISYINDQLNFNRAVLPKIQANYEFGLDVETSGLDPYNSKLLLLQISTPDEIFVINVQNIERRLIVYVIDLINASNKLVVGTNIRFDLKFLLHNYGVIPNNVFDVMLAEVLSYSGIGKNFYSLDELSKKHLGIKLDKDVRSSFIDKQDSEFTEEQIIYSAKDVEVLLPLKICLENQLKKRGQLNTWNEIEKPLIPVVASMEYYGIGLDKTTWQVLEEEMQQIAEDYSIQLNQYLLDNFNSFAGEYSNALDVCNNIGITVKTKKDKKFLSEIVQPTEISRQILANWINLNSPLQLLHILNKLDVPVEDTNSKTLAQYKGFPIVKLLLGYRPAKKKTTSFGDKILNKINEITGKIHADFNQLGTYSGRFSSSNPNMQQIPRDVRYRRAFVASPGYKILTIDYSQIELRLMGEISGETKFIDAFIKEKDLHIVTAALIKEKQEQDVTKDDRHIGKTVNFAVIYGTSKKGLYYNFGIPEDDGEVYLRNYFTEYNTINSFIRSATKRIIDSGYSITLTGRKRFFTIPKTPSRKDFRLLNEISRQGINHIVQGTSADMTKLAMNKIYHGNPFGNLLRILMTVHDEIVIEIHESILVEGKEFVENCMLEAGKRFLKTIPVKFESIVENNWSK